MKDAWIILCPKFDKHEEIDWVFVKKNGWKQNIGEYKLGVNL